MAEGEEGGGGSRCTVKGVLLEYTLMRGTWGFGGNAWVGGWVEVGTMCSGGGLLLGI